MLNQQKLRCQFNERGYIIVPHLFNSHQTIYLREICERIFTKWQRKSLKRRIKFNKKSLDLFKRAEYFSNYSEQLQFLFKVITDEKITSILNCVCEQQLLFNGVVYFFNPRRTSWHGDWHRDGQIIAPNDAIEKSRIFSSFFIRVHIALIVDDFLEIVTNSHSRWDTATELEIRYGLNDQPNNSDLMPNSHKIHLNPGDAVFFDGYSYSIHRGNYFKNKLRRTLAILYGSSVDWYTPTLDEQIKSKILLNLPAQKQALFYL